MNGICIIFKAAKSVNRPGWRHASAAFALICLLVSPLTADRLHLKSGRVFRDVIAIPQKKGMVVVFPDGRTRYIATHKIALASSRNVRWPRPVSRARLKKLIEKRARERIRNLSFGDETGDLWSDSIALQDVEPLEGGRRAVLWRSALLPGWGQFYESRRRTAAGFFLPAAALGLAYLDNRRRLFDARDRFDQSVLLGAASLNNPFNAVAGVLGARLQADAAARDEAEFAGRGNLLLLLLAALHAWNLYDAYQGDEPPRLSLRVDMPASLSPDSRDIFASGDTTGRALRIAFSIRF